MPCRDWSARPKFSIPERLPPGVLEILHRRTDLRPVRGGHGEDIGIALTIRGIGPAKAWRQPGDFVRQMPWRQGVDHRCAVIEHRDRPVALEAFVGFDAPVDLVAMLHLDIAQRVALHAPLLVHQLDIIEDALAELDANGFRRPGTVALPTNDNVLLHGGSQAPHTHDPYQDKTRNQPAAERHSILL